jgi:UDP-N-acetylmuramate dehydrogenase
MTIERDVSLTNYSTMGLGGQAKYLATIESKEDLIEAINFALQNKLKVLMVGDGSNIVWQDSGFDGLLLICGVRGFEVESENDEGADILIGAGENWDLVVDRAVSLGLSGIECLSLIPGKAGATPVQNVGAYGQEIAETLISLEAYDYKNQSFLTMQNKDCDFSYRNSCFKKEPGRYFILSIRLHLKKGQLSPPFYKALDNYLKTHNITDTSPKTLREAVINIRQAKLPDPKNVKNCGSFFKNPIVPSTEYKRLAEQFEDIPHWDTSDGQVKLSAAWLIELAGFKDYSDQESGMSTWKSQPLILVNEHAKTTADLLRFKQKVIDAVKGKFDIELFQEPQLLP